MFLIGAVDGLKETAIMRAYLVDFFDHELLGQQAKLLQKDLQDEYIELVVK